MLYLVFEDWLHIIAKSSFLTLIFTPLILGTFYLVKLNYEFSLFICNLTDISYDLRLTVTSLGFGDEIVLIMTLTEIIFLTCLFYKLKKTRLCKSIYKFFSNF